MGPLGNLEIPEINKVAHPQNVIPESGMRNLTMGTCLPPDTGKYGPGTPQGNRSLFNPVDMNLCAIHAKCMTILPKDMQLVRRILGETLK